MGGRRRRVGSRVWLYARQRLHHVQRRRGTGSAVVRRQIQDVARRQRGRNLGGFGLDHARVRGVDGNRFVTCIQPHGHVVLEPLPRKQGHPFAQGVCKSPRHRGYVVTAGLHVIRRVVAGAVCDHRAIRVCFRPVEHYLRVRYRGAGVVPNRPGDAPEHGLRMGGSAHAAGKQEQEDEEKAGNST